MESVNSNSFQNILLNNDNLESIYSMLKGESSELRRSQIKKMFENFDAKSFEGMSNNSEKSLESDDKNTECAEENDVISLDQFCKIFKNIFENSKNPKSAFTEGFAMIDRNK